MQFAKHHTFALLAALGLSAIALNDAVTHGLTGEYSVFADDGPTWIVALGDVIHGLAYAGGLAVLRAERQRIHANRAASIFGWLLFAAFVPLALGFLLAGIVPLRDSLMTLGGPVIGVAFGLQFLAALGLGLSLVKRPETGVGSRILLAILPAIGVTVALAVFATDWAHPAYVETVTIIGTALLATSTRRASLDTPTSGGNIGVRSTKEALPTPSNPLPAGNSGRVNVR
ncbi:hypothetical protein N802_04545 [Knoellia sinensis KCTC 19936]|uniref:DUF998 domain-containing protein n=1 Tax=Knoellia sinensis KCTC 19936 TaxID=1385520 RepID=A0A0A0J1S6_9MICO|nr:hypothetical protein [Knoellia sinensis]KGN31365.1 hypothetical protein N802_04545 [Knoellia sinensis KCTC 19936]